MLPILRFSTWPFLCSALASRGELGRSIEPGQFYYWTWMSIVDFLISYFSFHGHLFQFKYQVWFHIPPSLERRIEAHLSLDSGLKVAKVVGLALWETLHQQLCDLNLYFCFAFAFVKLSLLVTKSSWFVGHLSVKLGLAEPQLVLGLGRKRSSENWFGEFGRERER